MKISKLKISSVVIFCFIAFLLPESQCKGSDKNPPSSLEDLSSLKSALLAVSVPTVDVVRVPVEGAVHEDKSVSSLQGIPSLIPKGTSYRYIILAASTGSTGKEFENQVRHWGLFIIDQAGKHVFTFESGGCTYFNSASTDFATLPELLKENKEIDLDKRNEEKEGFYCIEKTSEGRRRRSISETIAKDFGEPGTESGNFKDYFAKEGGTWRHPNPALSFVKALAWSNLNKDFTIEKIAQALIDGTEIAGDSPGGPKNNPCQRGAADFLARWAEGGNELFPDKVLFSDANARRLTPLLSKSECLELNSKNIGKFLLEVQKKGKSSSTIEDQPREENSTTNREYQIDIESATDHTVEIDTGSHGA